MKKLILTGILAASLIVVGSCEPRERVVPEHLIKKTQYAQIPEQFRNYKLIQREPCTADIVGGQVYHAHHWKTNGNAFVDVRELFNNVDDKYPIFYLFDINGDGKYDAKYGEVFYDPKVDGLNGNEEILKPRYR